MLRIGIVAGEKSGDALAADLMRALKARRPDMIFEGIAGPEMIDEGCKAIFQSEELAVMGLTEVLKHLPRLLDVRKKLTKHFISNPPDIFIGVDAPDFNLALEKMLKEKGIKTVHYVSPSVWAWRQYRVKKIAKSVDKMLALFPFEAQFYEKHNVPVKFVGHPMADQIPLQCDTQKAREDMLVPSDKKVVGLLPGSRRSEVEKLLPLMLDTASYLSHHEKDLFFLIPAATPALKEFIENHITHRDKNNISIKILEGHARNVMQSSDVLLLASGTAALEAMLFKKPMIVTYKVSPLSYWIIKKLASVTKVSLPNHFDDEDPVPEYIQDDAVVEKLGPAMLELLRDESLRDEICKNFLKYHQQLNLNASEQAAIEILTMVGENAVCQ